MVLGQGRDAGGSGGVVGGGAVREAAFCTFPPVMLSRGSEEEPWFSSFVGTQ